MMGQSSPSLTRYSNLGSLVRPRAKVQLTWCPAAIKWKSAIVRPRTDSRLSWSDWAYLHTSVLDYGSHPMEPAGLQYPSSPGQTPNSRVADFDAVQEDRAQQHAHAALSNLHQTTVAQSAGSEA